MTPARAWLLPFAAAVIGMMALQMSSLGFSPLLPSIQAQFGMSYAQLGLFTGMYGLLAIALSVPAGLLAKRFGEKPVLLGGMLVIALGLTALSRSVDYPTALAARGLWLAGYRLAFVCVLTAVAITCPPALKGRSMGVVGAVASLASVVGAPFGSSIGQAFGWRNGILAFAGATLVGALVVLSFYRSSSGGDAPGRHGFAAPAPGAASARSAFRTPIVWALALLVGLVGVGQFSATFFVPSAARTIFGLDAVSASLIISTGYLLAIPTNLLVGYLMDRYDKWRVLAIVMLLMVPASLAMTSGVLILFRLGTALLLALGFTATNQVYGVAGDVLTGRESGNVMGVVSLGAGICGYLGPQMLGALRDWTGGFDAGWYLVMGVAMFTLFEIYLLHRYALTARPAAGATSA